MQGRPCPDRRICGCVAGEIDHGARSRCRTSRRRSRGRPGAPVACGSRRCVVERQLVARQIRRVDESNGSFSSASSALRHRVLRDTQPDGLAARILQAPRHLARGAQNERIAARRGGLEHAICAIVHARVVRDLREVAAHQGEMVAARRPRGWRGCDPSPACRRSGSRARSRSRSDTRSGRRLHDLGSLLRAGVAADESDG